MEQTNVQQYLKGCGFPCGRDEIARVAKRNDAPEDVQEALQDLPERRFHNADEVSRELEKTTAPTA